LTVTRKPGQDNLHHLYVGWSISTFSNNLFGSMIPYRNASSNGALVEYWNGRGRDITWDQWSILVQSNQNTMDGAVFTVQLNGTNDNLTLVIDQATGRFLDNTNVTVQPVLIAIRYQYVQGDNTCSMRSIIIRNDIGNNQAT